VVSSLLKFIFKRFAVAITQFSNYQPVYHEALQTLRTGKTLLYPTDTVWGLGCDATNPIAVEQLYSLKQRPDHKAFIILISKIEQLSLYVEKVPDIAWDIVEFAEKPLTVVYPKAKNLAPNLIGEDGSIAIRLVKDEFCQGLVHRFGKAIVSTSANLSGEPSPKTFADISENIRNKVDYILQPPPHLAMTGIASTIMKLGINGEVQFLRK
jgi:L-threonylcarbamoyladenylate synthase